MAEGTAILLDALGTLIELRPPAPPLTRELHLRFGLEVSPEQAERALAAEIAFYRAHLQEGVDAVALARLRAACAEVLRGALPPSPELDRVSAPELTEALLAALQFTPYPEVPGALRAAREAGRRLIVVSNWDVSLHEVLERTGLRELLDGVLTSAEVGVRKPGGAIFARALALARCPAREALHVGDSLEEDVAGARAAGIEPILVWRGASPRPAGVRAVAGLDELVRELAPP